MVSESVLTEIRGQVLLITLHRPEKLNAIDRGVADQLVAAVDLLDSGSSLRVGVLTGAGRAFCSGMDLTDAATHGAPPSIWGLLRGGPTKPLIAAVNGLAYGGGLELALCCDLVVAAATATFAVPEVRVGLIAGGGALHRLPRSLPHGVAMRMALTGDPIDAPTAHRYGLVTELTTPGGAVPAALAIADRIAANAPLSVRATARAIRDMVGRTDHENWELQRALVDVVGSSPDAREGMAAFAAHRDPVWQEA